jgi:hypothetical protein
MGARPLLVTARPNIVARESRARSWESRCPHNCPAPSVGHAEKRPTLQCAPCSAGTYGTTGPCISAGGDPALTTAHNGSADAQAPFRRLIGDAAENRDG